MNRYYLTTFPTRIMFLSPSMRVASQEWHRTTMIRTMIIMMSIATLTKTHTTLLEYPLSLQQPAEKFQECTHQEKHWNLQEGPHQKSQRKSQEWLHQKMRYMTMFYLPSFQVTMTATISLMAGMIIHTCPHSSTKGSSTLSLCHQR